MNGWNFQPHIYIQAMLREAPVMKTCVGPWVVHQKHGTWNTENMSHDSIIGNEMFPSKPNAENMRCFLISWGKQQHVSGMCHPSHFPIRKGLGLLYLGHWGALHPDVRTGASFLLWGRPINYRDGVPVKQGSEQLRIPSDKFSQFAVWFSIFTWGLIIGPKWAILPCPWPC